ncbi:MAG: hypothetical protein FWH04_00215 [Oscillospiraceae bacterium]|nr:hypothetical protein [Oscillospiraceae bacterium]
MKRKTMKKLGTLTLSLLMLLALLPMSAPKAEGFGSTGKFLAAISAPAAGSEPISTASQLANIRYDLNKSYHLTGNIDLSGIDNWNPLGMVTSSSVATFRGTFDGQGYVIRGLSIREENQYNGLFGVTVSANIKNVGLEDVSIYSEKETGEINGGGLIGFAQDTTITNCYIEESDVLVANYEGTTGHAYAGGIVGRALDVQISYCFGMVGASAYSIEANAYTGGITGFGGTISDSWSDGESSASAEYGSAYIGGITGLANADITNCYSKSEVFIHESMDDAYAGGIAGYSVGVKIIRCYNIGSVYIESEESSYIGGIAGRGGQIENCYNNGGEIYGSGYYVFGGGISGRAAKIINCYNMGMVDLSAYAICNIGGIVGHNAGDSVGEAIATSYNSGKLYGFGENGTRIGGVAGWNNPGFTGAGAVNCYWNGDTEQSVNGKTLSSSEKKGAGFGEAIAGMMTSEYMKTQSRFTGFNFTNVWEMKPGTNNGYPVLRGVPHLEPIAHWGGLLVYSTTHGNSAFIDLENEIISKPSNFDIAAYSVNGGLKWKKWPTGKTNDAKQKKIDKLIPKLFNKKLVLHLSDQLNAKGKPETKNVDTSKTIKFPEIQARNKKNHEKLKPVLSSSDSRYELKTKKGNNIPQDDYQWAVTADKKTPSGAWQQLSSWSAPTSVKATYLVRTPASINGNLIKPSGKIFKVVLKVPK